MILIKRICFILLLIIIFSVIVHIKDKKVFAEKIDLNLDNEVGIILYSDTNLSFLLEINDDINKLILFRYDKRFEKIKSVFNIQKIDYLIADYPYIKSINYDTLSSTYKLKIYNYEFCIINESNSDTNNCTFIYLNYFDENLKFNDQNKVLFYGSDASDDFREKMYTKWLDIYEINNISYTIVKIKKDAFNIINIPI